MNGGEAASKGAERRILGRSGLNDGKSTLAKRPEQPPICPECGSAKTWKDGLRKTGVGVIQRWLCRDCGLRFSESNLKFPVKVDVPGKVLEGSHSPQDLADRLVFSSDVALEERMDQLALVSRKDVGSHVHSQSSIVGETLNKPFAYSRRRRVCVSESEMKNLAKVETRTEAGQRETAKEAKSLIFEYAWWMKKQ